MPNYKKLKEMLDNTTFHYKGMGFTITRPQEKMPFKLHIPPCDLTRNQEIRMTATTLERALEIASEYSDAYWKENG